MNNNPKKDAIEMAKTVLINIIALCAREKNLRPSQLCGYHEAFIVLEKYGVSPMEFTDNVCA